MVTYYQCPNFLLIANSLRTLSSVYHSETNDLKITTCLKDRCMLHLFNLTDAEKEKIIDTMASGGLNSKVFNSNACDSSCTSSHLTVTIPSLNQSNSLSWTSQSLDTLDSLSKIRDPLIHAQNITKFK